MNLTFLPLEIKELINFHCTPCTSLSLKNTCKEFQHIKFLYTKQSLIFDAIQLGRIKIINFLVRNGFKCENFFKWEEIIKYSTPEVMKYLINYAKMRESTIIELIYVAAKHKNPQMMIAIGNKRQFYSRMTKIATNYDMLDVLKFIKSTYFKLDVKYITRISVEKEFIDILEWLSSLKWLNIKQIYLHATQLGKFNVIKWINHKHNE